MVENLSSHIKTPFQYKIADTLGIRTKYLVAGSGPPIILIHGAGAGAIAWFSVIDALAAGFSVFAPDVVGYGESDKPSSDYSRDYFSSWLYAFCDTLEINNCILVGHSQGGAISLQFVLDHPDRVSQLLLISPAGFGWLCSLLGVINGLWFYCFPSYANSFRLHSRLVYHRSQLHDDFIRYAMDVCQMPGGKRVIWQGLGKCLVPFNQKQLRRIGHRTLIIWGKEDRLIPPRNGLRAVRAMPNAQIQWVPQAGHIPFLDQPEIVNQLLLQFLSKSK